MKILYTREQWEQNPHIKFTKQQLDNAENNQDGFIGYSGL